MSKIVNQIAIFLLVIVPGLFVFQNCSKAKFSNVGVASMASSAQQVVSPICDVESRPLENENVACLPPNQSLIKAVQRFDVICKDNGKWSRSLRNTDYSLCGSCSPAQRLSDKENVACPAPYGDELKGIQNYAVSCLSNGTWSRTAVGAVDYSACSKVCDPAMKPPTTSAVACTSPNSSIISGVQNYNVICNSDGSWSRMVSGAIDYKNCPQSCDPMKMPAAKENAMCPLAAVMNAVQNYQVICAVNGVWTRTPTTFDTSACPQPATCNAASKPPASESVFCSAPYATVKSAVQYYSVICSGTNWVQAPTTKDESACPKACAGVQPANSATTVACQAPYATSILAKQNYKYVCNTTTGNYDKTADGAVDYSACPKNCTGSPPANREVVSCPAGQSGTAYQNYSVTCNSATGTYTRMLGTYDTSACSMASCSGVKPPTEIPVACPSPFADRKDAKQGYKVECVNGNWTSTIDGAVNTSSCPVNDCSGSVNPGTKKIIGACSGGATGSITQTCQVSCTGKTYSQINCTADDYSSCDCGVGSTYNTTTKTCSVNPSSYSWSSGSWGACSGTCGATNGGSQSRSVVCKSAAGATVSDSMCSAAGAKPATSQSCTAPAVIGTCNLCKPNQTGSAALLPGVPAATGSFNYWYYSIVMSPTVGTMDMTCNASGTDFGKPGVLKCAPGYVVDPSKTPFLASHGVVGECVPASSMPCTAGSTLGSCKLCNPGGVGASALLPGVPAASASFNYWYYSIVMSGTIGNMDLTCNASGTDFGKPGVITCKAPYVLDTTKSTYFASHAVMGECVLPSTDVYCPEQVIKAKSMPNIQGKVNYCTYNLPRTKWVVSYESTVGPLVAATVTSGSGYSTAACQKNGTWMSCTPEADGYCIGDGRGATACDAPPVTSYTWQRDGSPYFCNGNTYSPDASSVEGTTCPTPGAFKNVTDGGELCPGGKGFMTWKLKCQ